MIAFLYRFRYFGAYVATIAASAHGLHAGKLVSGDFATIATVSFGILCGAGAGARFAKKGNTNAPDPNRD